MAWSHNGSVVQESAWERQQCRAFVGWMNSIFKMASKPERLYDLETDLTSGVLLAQLFETLTEAKVVVYPHPRHKLHCISNLNAAIAVLRTRMGDRELVNISAEDIYDGKLSIILGFIWNTILCFGFHNFQSKITK